jgi:hypothetical protein
MIKLEDIKDIVSNCLIKDKDYIDNLNSGSSAVLVTLIENNNNIDLDIQELLGDDNNYDSIDEIIERINNYIYFFGYFDYNIECELNKTGLQIILRK